MWTDALADPGRRIGAPAVARTDTLDRLRPFAAAAGVDGVVLVQTIGSELETEQLLGLAAIDPLVVGVVGWADLAAEDLPERLDRLLSCVGGGYLAGIRFMVPPIADDFADSPIARGMRAIADRDLALDLLLTPNRLPDAAAIVAAVPGLRFVIDHLAKPDIVGNDLGAVRAGLVELARHDAVAVKLSGLLTQIDPELQGVEDLRPYVDAALDLFGPQRIMLGSDWPLCEPVGGYQLAMSAMEGLAADWAARHKQPLAPDTAGKWYRLQAG
ncbi:amidohydrolase family protein [Gryllotalpicola koreensis]|uniref:Amidohydrolase family protein n=1 Tax=Gryllotalpicola koreensis TaxID=993086 RepID=A0ABP8A5C8_9MICO